MADNVLIATANDANGAHQKIVNEFLDAGGLPVSVTAANPLPVLASVSTVGLATSTGQNTGNASLSSIDGKIPSGLAVTAGRLQVELPAGGSGLTNAELRATPIPVSFTGGGDATAANQTTGNNSLASIDTKTPSLGQALAAASTPVVLTAAQVSTLTPPAQITGYALAANQQTNAITDAQIRATPLPISGTVNTGLSQPLTDTQIRATALPISAAALPLPTGASTSSLQTSGNSSLSNIDTKTPSLGQALAASSTPVVLTAAQVTTLTPQTNALTDAQIRATPLPISGTVSTGGLTDTQIRATALPISAASLPLPTGAATEATLGALNTKIPSGLVVTTGRLQVELPAGGTGLTNTELRATPVPVSGTVTANATLSAETTKVIGTVNVAGTVPISGALTDTQLRASAVPISAAALPLPSGAATSANQTTVGSQTTKINDGTNTVAVLSAAPASDTGQSAMAVRVISQLGAGSGGGGGLEPSLSGSGSLALINSAVTLALNGQYANATFQVGGAWTGTLVFEASNDSFATITTINALRAGNNTVSQSVIDSTNNDIYRVTVAGFGAVRLIASTALTGAAVVTAFASAKTSGVFLNLPIPAGTNLLGKVGIDQTTAGDTNGVQITALSYPQSTGNNSVAQLAAGATFTGAIETVLSLQAAQVMVTCDTAYTVFIDQFIDLAGTKLVATYTFTRLAGVPTNENVTLPGNYMRIRVTNNGAATTTTFRLDTTFGIMNTQPNTLSNLGNLRVVAQENGVPSVVNSTSTNLAANAVFTGTSEDVSEFSTAMVTIFSSHASATDGLSVQFSSNGTDWDFTDVFTIPATTGRTFSFGIVARFYRLVYTNGATLTTSLRIQTLFSRTTKKSSSQRPSDGRANDNDFEEMSSFLMGYNGTSWDRLRSSITKGLDVNPTESRAASLGVTVTAATGVGATLTLPAAGAGLFHYISSLDITLYSTAARTGVATPIVVTTTNISGTIAFTFATAGAIGTTDIQDLISATPLKSLTANTATTIVAPVVTGGIWRITATYFTGA